MQSPVTSCPATLSHLSLPHGLLLALLFCARLAGQTPSTIIAVRVDEYDQNSASQTSVYDSGFAIQVTFKSPPLTSVSVEVRKPDGTFVALQRVDEGIYYSERFLPTISERNAAYPRGTYRVDVNGAAASQTSFTIDAPPDLVPSKISNYEAIRTDPNYAAPVTLEAIAGYTSNDLVQFKVLRANGIVDDIAPSSLTPVPTFPNAVTADQGFDSFYGYTKFTRTSLASGAIDVATGDSWGVYCSILRVGVAPTILTQPTDIVAGSGYPATFRVVSTAGTSATYQWKKDGVVLAGKTDSTLSFTAVTAADAGVYTVDVKFGTSTATSASARLSIGASLQVATLTKAISAVLALTSDAAGNLYAADHYCIKKITAGGVVSTLAGVQDATGSSDGVGSAARLGSVRGIAVDSNGQIFLSDGDFHTIRKLSPDGTVTTIAGLAGSRGATDGQGSSARFDSPRGLTIDSAGNLYVADSANHTIRKITPSGKVTTLAGQAGVAGSANGAAASAQFSHPAGVGVAADGTIYVADTSNDLIRKIDLSGTVSTLAGRMVGGSDYDGAGASAIFAHPTAIALAPGGVLVVADSDDGYIRTVSPDGWTSTVAGGGTNVEGLGAQVNGNNADILHVDAAGQVFFALSLGNTISRGTWVNGTPLPAFSTQPVSRTIGIGGTVVLTAAGSGDHVSYQWKKNGVVLPGETNSSLIVTQGTAGTYTVDLVSPTTAGVSSQPASLQVSSQSANGRILNMSVRTNAGYGNDTLIAGFVIGGNPGTTQPLLVRGNGPALAAYNLPNYLPNPLIKLINTAGAELEQNDDWGGGASLMAAANRLGAFAITPSNSRDAALLTALPPGPYSMHVIGPNQSPGMVLAEIFDATEASAMNPNAPSLINVSTRALVGTGDNVLIVGFVIGGPSARTLLIRGLGPQLTAFGVNGALADPLLKIYKGSTKLVENDNWGGSAQLSAVASSVGAGAWSNPKSKDAAVVLTLEPGVYSAELSGVNTSTGVGLLEIYATP